MQDEKQPEDVVRAEGLTVRRGGRAIVDDVSFAIDPGPPFAIVGESGAGKSTILLAATGLIKAASGRVLVAGQDISRVSGRERARLVGIVFQEYELFPHLSVLENVMLAPTLRGDGEVEKRARTLFEELAIPHLADRQPHELSGGQKQRVAIARGLVLEPRVLFFDEPSAALDERTTGDLARLLERISERSQVVIVSHDKPFLELCCPRGVRVHAGKIASEGALAGLFA